MSSRWQYPTSEFLRALQQMMRYNNDMVAAYKRFLRGLMAIFAAIAMICGFAAFSGCASSSDTGIEEAKFALDSGDWDKAIQSASAVLADDPSNVEAALALAEAYAGRSGITVMKLMTTIADRTKDRDLFDAVQDVAIDRPTKRVHMGDLGSAIDTLANQLKLEPAPKNSLYPDVLFETAVLRIIEAFLTPSYAAQPDNEGAIDAENITEDDRARVQDDLLQADNELEAAGVSDSDGLITNMRETWCVLKNLSAPFDGISLSVLRDLVLCQISTDDGNALTAADFESPNITSCSDFDFSACSAAGPTEQ